MISKPLLALSSSAVLLGFMLASAPASAQALKTAKLCNDEYAAQKPALKAAKEMKKEFVTACRALPVGTATPVGSVPAAAATPAPAQTTAAAPATASGQVKSAGACDAEYKANRGALRDAKEKKKDFIAACRALPPGASDADRHGCDHVRSRAASATADRTRIPAAGRSCTVHAASTRARADNARSACIDAIRSEPVRGRGRSQGPLPRRDRRVGEHAIEDLPFRWHEELREHESRRLHVRNRCDRGRGSRIRDRKASVIVGGTFAGAAGFAT